MRGGSWEEKAVRPASLVRPAPFEATRLLGKPSDCGLAAPSGPPLHCRRREGSAGERTSFRLQTPSRRRPRVPSGARCRLLSRRPPRCVAPSRPGGPHAGSRCSFGPAGARRMLRSALRTSLFGPRFGGARKLPRNAASHRGREAAEDGAASVPCSLPLCFRGSESVKGANPSGRLSRTASTSVHCHVGVSNLRMLNLWGCRPQHAEEAGRDNRLLQ